MMSHGQLTDVAIGQGVTATGESIDSLQRLWQQPAQWFQDVGITKSTVDSGLYKRGKGGRCFR